MGLLPTTKQLPCLPILFYYDMLSYDIRSAVNILSTRVLRVRPRHAAVTVQDQGCPTD
jgi:hypothetical protein